MLAARRRTSHSKGPGSVSSKSFRSNTSARSGDRVAIAAYLGSSERFEDALAEYAVAYADRAEADHAILVEAIRDGRVAAAAGEAAG